jgi:hypothetical protein
MLKKPGTILSAGCSNDIRIKTLSGVQGRMARENAVNKQPAKPNAKPAAARKPASRKGSRSRSSSSSDRPKNAGRPGGGPTPDRADRLVTKASAVAYEAADTVFEVASQSASSVSRQVAGLHDNQVLAGADVISQVAQSTRLAADDLEAKVPQVAGVVRSVADRIDIYADGMKDQSVEQMLATASGFTRRQPAMVFSLAALAGFLLFRALKSGPDYAGRSARANRNDE